MLSMLLHKCWSLKMISQNPWVDKGILKTIIFLDCFIFQNSNSLYVFSTKYSVFLMVLRKNKILSQVWHTTLNFFYTQSIQTPQMNSWVYFKRKPSICLPNYLVFLPFILIWHNILRNRYKKRKYLTFFTIIF